MLGREGKGREGRLYSLCWWYFRRTSRKTHEATPNLFLRFSKATIPRYETCLIPGEISKFQKFNYFKNINITLIPGWSVSPWYWICFIFNDTPSARASSVGRRAAKNVN